MGELRSLNGTRDEMMKEIASAPPDASIIILVDSPSTAVHMRWTGIPNGKEGRILSFLSAVMQRVALGFMNQVPRKQEEPVEPTPPPKT